MVRHAPDPGQDGFPYRVASASWAGILANWPHHVTRWNRAGIDWRKLTFSEILWLVHTENIEYLREHNPRGMRRYLIDMKDEETLIIWDREQMKARPRE